MSDATKCYAATPAATLEQHITASNVAKNDAEWWAHREIKRLREENARLRDLLAEGDAALSWVLLEGIDEAYPTTCPVEYARIVDAAKAIAAAIQEGEKDDI